ncbi:unnamed protein product [Ilex paraguariensis]|uniref:MADS-box domain-containing protein n=1 Tax=Ilex paraguariensis TaxID=185542 RepID=A0ABC8SJ84_9AQUA
MGMGKKKIEIKKKEKELDGMVTFSKRRQGLFKKARELHLRTNANVAILVFLEVGQVYTHGDPSFEATIDKYLSTHQEIIIRDDHVPTGQVYTHGNPSSKATIDKYLTTNQESHRDCETNS